MRSEEDRRVVLVSLTEKGKKAFRHHEKFHEDMIQATLKDLSPDETKVLVKALTNLCGFFQQKSGNPLPLSETKIDVLFTEKFSKEDFFA